MVGPKEMVFEVLASFAQGIKEECGCELNVAKCKMFSFQEGAREEARRAGFIPPALAYL